MEIKNPKWNQYPYLQINNISLNQDKVRLDYIKYTIVIINSLYKLGI